MSADGFDIRELTKFEKKLTTIANDTMPKESRKFMKKSSIKLNKANKVAYKSKGIDEKTGNLLKGFKSGKAYKYNGVWSSRAFNSSPHAHLLDQGYMWKPHKGENGTERFIPGFHFMEQGAKSFQSGYYDDTEDFLHQIFLKGL